MAEQAVNGSPGGGDRLGHAGDRLEAQERIDGHAARVGGPHMVTYVTSGHTLGAGATMPPRLE